jgi:hypothetical protein
VKRLATMRLPGPVGCPYSGWGGGEKVVC